MFFVWSQLGECKLQVGIREIRAVQEKKEKANMFNEL
jgi:hypothetical protein